MALNDLSLTPQAGVDMYPGVSNPTKSNVQGNPYDSNFVTDPTDPTAGAGAGPNFHGGQDAKRSLEAASGVVESRPGIIGSTNIDPLNAEVDNKMTDGSCIDNVYDAQFNDFDWIPLPWDGFLPVKSGVANLTVLAYLDAKK